MSIYDHRDRTAYTNDGAEPHYSKNPHILQWWTPSHDEALAKHFEEMQCFWRFGIQDEILAITPTDTIEIWKLVDPLCAKHGWYNVLEGFAGSRAETLGLTKDLREPGWKFCRLCGRWFCEGSLSYPLVKRLGVDGLDFCASCLESSLYQGGGDAHLSEERVIGYIKDLTEVLQRVPPQNFGQGISDLVDMSSDERLAVLKLLRKRPTSERVKELFGSWLEALIEAGVLEDGARRTSRGTQCLAKDGHICLSLGEKTIDDFLYNRGIPHDIEPSYPEGNFRADFKVGGVLIEYFGLKGDPDYDAKTKLKQRICRKYGIKLIAVYPSDLVSTKKLEAKLLRGLAEIGS